jgi:predicted nucleotidyltransferase
MVGIGMSRESLTADDVVARLREHEAELRAAGICRLSLFGSLARAEDRADPGSGCIVVMRASRRALRALLSMRYNIDGIEKILRRSRSGRLEGRTTPLHPIIRLPRGGRG